jgi:hypothetical protein
VSSEGGSFANLIFHVGADWQVRCSTYPHSTPILCLDGGSSSVMITNGSRTATEEAIEFARALVKQAQCFAAEPERMQAEQSGDTGKADTKAA